MFTDNPFDGLKSAKRIQVNPGSTIRDVLTQHFKPTTGDYASFWEFPCATACIYNGELCGRDKWTRIKPKDGDVVVFTALPGDYVAIVLAIVAIIAAIVAIVMMPDPGVPTDGMEAAEPAYTLTGMYNRNRLGQPIEDIYGRCRVFPSYASTPYTRYIDGDSWQFSLFSMGKGEFAFHKYRLEDTETSEFEDVTLEIVPPGGTLTLFESSSYGVVEVANLELFGPNQAEYTGYYGGFIVNPANTTIDHIEVDVTWPQGLYRLSKGLRFPLTVTIQFQYRLVDTATGAALGSWTDFVNETVSRKTNSPVRITFRGDVANGRYEIRGRRTSNKNLGTEYVSTTMWEAGRGIADSQETFAEETVIAMKAKATNNLNNGTRSRFNVDATRKLPIWDTLTNTWSAPTATQNPVWAFCNIFRARWGAQLPDEYLDMDTLYNLASVFDDRGDTFNWIFDQRITIWEAAKMCLRVGRAIPIPQGSLVTAVRDVAQDLPAAMFTQNNISQGTMRKNLLMYEFNPYNALIIEYTNKDTWNPEEVLCSVPWLSPTNPDKLKLAGCTDRTQAYREGMVIFLRRLYCRKTLTFETGLEGHIPSFMDMVSVTHPVVRLGRGGAVMAYNTGTNEMTLSDRVSFEPGFTHKLLLRGTDGAAMAAPITVTAGSSPNKVILATDPPDTLDFSLNRTPNLYHFGVESLVSFMGNLTRIAPKGYKNVELTVVNYDARVYGYDDVDPPALIDSARIKDPDAPLVENVVIATSEDDKNIGIVSWTSRPGVLRYIVEQSVDNGDTWETLATLKANIKSYRFNIIPGDMIIRVSAQGQSGIKGQWATSPVKTVGISGTPPSAPALNGSQPAFTGLSASATWQPSAAALGYSVEVHLVGDPVALREADVFDSLSYAYTLTNMLADNAGVPHRDLEIWVFAYNTGGPSTPATVATVNNPKPPVLTSLSAVLFSGSQYDFDWADLVSMPADFDNYRLYGSTVSGFTPGAGNLLYSGSLSTCRLTLSATLYWRVAAFDKWASGHTDANFTTEQTRAYP